MNEHFSSMIRDVDRLGDILKGFEENTQSLLIPGLPVIMRLDGKTFSKFTKGLERPFDAAFRHCMIETTKYIAKLMNAVAAYTQSDEITLVIMNPLNINDNSLSSVMFSSRVQKLVSISAAKASTYFNKMLEKHLPAKAIDAMSEEIDCPVLDSRAFNVPNEEWAALAVYWREVDCRKNAITQAASVVYSHKELMHKNSGEKIEMMHQKGVNFEAYPDTYKRGTYVLKKRIFVELTAEELVRIPEKNRPTGPIERSAYLTGALPRMGSLENPVQVLFDPLATVCFTEVYSYVEN